MELTTKELAISIYKLRQLQKTYHLLLARSRSTCCEKDKERAMRALADKNLMESKMDALLDTILELTTK